MSAETAPELKHAGVFENTFAADENTLACIQ